MKKLLVATFVALLVVFAFAPASWAQTPRQVEIKGTMTMDPDVVGGTTALPTSSYELVKEGGKWIYRRVEKPPAFSLSDESAQDLVRELESVAEARRTAATAVANTKSVAKQLEDVAKAVKDNADSITSLTSTTSRLVTRIADVETTVGDSDSGLAATRKVADQAASDARLGYWGFWVALLALVIGGVTALLMRRGGGAPAPRPTITPWPTPTPTPTPMPRPSPAGGGPAPTPPPPTPAPPKPPEGVKPPEGGKKEAGPPKGTEAGKKPEAGKAEGGSGEKK